MTRKRQEYETAIIISGTDKGGIKILEATGDQVEELRKKQKQGADGAEKYGKKHKDAGDDVSTFSKVVTRGIDIVVKAAAATAAAITGLVTINSKVIAEQARTAQMLGISTQALQAQAHMAKMAGLDVSEYGDVLRDVTVRVREFASIGTGEAADFFEALNLDIEEFKDLAPDELLSAIGKELEGLNRNDRLLFLDQLGSDQATRLVDVIHKLDDMEQEAIAIGVALSDVDAEQVNQAAVGLEKAQSVMAGTANQITAGLAPIVSDLTTRFYDAAVEAGGIESAIESMVEKSLVGIGFLADRVHQMRGLLKMIELGWLAVASVGINAVSEQSEAIAEFITNYLTIFRETLEDVSEGWSIILYGLSQAPLVPFKDKLLAASDALRDFAKDTNAFTVDSEIFVTANERTQAALANTRAELEALIDSPPPSDRLQEWYEEVKLRAEELAEATIEANNAQGESVQVTSQQQAAAAALVEQMEFENSLIGMSSLEQKIQNNLRKAGADATDEQRAAIRRLTIERHREEEAIADLKQETERLAEVQSNQMENFQREFTTKVVDVLKAGRFEIESIRDLLENGVFQGIGNWLGAGTTNLVYGGGNESGGLGASIANSFGIGGIAAKSGGLLAAGGDFLGGLFGTNAGLMGPPTQAAAAGANVGAFLTNPLTIGLGLLAYGASNDFWADPDGFKNSMAGMLVGPTPGANPAGLFEVDPFASGFTPMGFADRRSRQDAIEAITPFRELDGTLTELVDLLGGNVDAMREATLAGLGVEGADGTRGTFLGQGGRTVSLDNQLLLYARQFANHIEGIDQSVIDALDAAKSYEEFIEILTQAVDEAGTNTGALADSEDMLTRIREAASQQIVASMNELGTAMDDLVSVQRQIENDILAARGISTIHRGAGSIVVPEGGTYADQLAAIEARRQRLLEQYDEEYALQLQLHTERQRIYREEIAMAGQLGNTIFGILGGSNSPLSNQQKFEMFGEEFDRLATLAESGDLDAAGKLNSLADSYVQAIRDRFASSAPANELIDNVLNRLRSVQDQFAGAQNPGEFDASGLSEALISGLESLQDQVTGVHDAIATDAVNQLVALNANVIALPDQIATAQNLPEVLASVVSSLNAAGLSLTVIADQIAQSAVLTQAANDYLADNGGGTVDDFTSSYNPAATPDLIQGYADQIVAKHGGANEAAQREFLTSIIDNNIGSRQVAEALGMDQNNVINIARSLGLPEFADGALVSSPTIALIGEGKRREGVFPLPDNFNIADYAGGGALASELRGMRGQIGEIVSIMNEFRAFYSYAVDRAGQQRDINNELFQQLTSVLAPSGPGSARYANAS
jgi:hypothetical protein